MKQSQTAYMRPNSKVSVALNNYGSSENHREPQRSACFAENLMVGSRDDKDEMVDAPETKQKHRCR
jgi:hypothetical protein